MKLSSVLSQWLSGVGLMLLLSACGSAATPTTVPPTATPIALTPAIIITAIPAAPEETAVLTETSVVETGTVTGTESVTTTGTVTEESETAGSTLPPETLAAIDDLLSTVYDGAPFQGAVLVARNGEILLRQGYGMADARNGTPNGPDTKFRLGSLTKPITAVGVLMLHNEGQLNVDDLICSYLDDCPAAWQAITIHNLLAHTSGIPDIVNLPDFPTFKNEATTPLQSIARLTGLPLDFATGERWQYSNSNYIILSAIIERASGQTYEAFVEEYIFAPLGMTNSGYDHNDGTTAVGYRPDGSTAEFIDMSVPAGAGGLYSSVNDLYLFDRALYTEQLLPQGLIDRMVTLQAALGPNEPNMGYGYGWIVVNEPDGPPGKMVAHNGAIEGFTTSIMRFLELDAVVIVLGNVEGRDPARVAESLAQKILFE